MPDNLQKRRCMTQEELDEYHRTHKPWDEYTAEEQQERIASLQAAYQERPSKARLGEPEITETTITVSWNSAFFEGVGLSIYDPGEEGSETITQKIARAMLTRFLKGYSDNPHEANAQMVKEFGTEADIELAKTCEEEAAFL